MTNRAVHGLPVKILVIFYPAVSILFYLVLSSYKRAHFVTCTYQSIVGTLVLSIKKEQPVALFFSFKSKCLLAASLHSETLVELIDTTTCIHYFLLTGVERVAS